MADSTTTNLSLTLPEVGVSTTWATSLNSNFTTLDESVLLDSTQTLSNKTLTSCDATTQSASNNSTKIATTAYVDSALNLQDSLAELVDVDVSGVSDNDVLAYDSTSEKFIDQSASAAGLQATITDGDLTIARTSGLQSALDGKQATITDGDLTIARTSGLQAALDLKAALASPALTGTPTSPTASAGDNSTQIATTAYVDSAVSSETDTLSGLTDTTITSIGDNDIIAYDSSSSKYINQTASEAGLATTSDLSSKLDTSAHTKASLDVDHLITLSGVTDASDDLGTFTGSTISDNDTVKGALQDVETAVETKQATIADGDLTIARTNGLQAALDAKQATISSSARLNADLIHDGSVSNTEFGYLSTVNSNIQTQINAISVSSVTEADIVALSIALG